MLENLINQMYYRQNNPSPRPDSFEQAKQLAQNIIQFQQEQRTAPIVKALQDIGMKWQAAKTDEERAALNAAANSTRQNFLLSGGAPMDLPTNLWGSDTAKGFQTGAEEFKPGFAGDNLSMGQRMKLAAMTGMFNGQKTFDREVAEAGFTGMFNGQKTWPREYQEMNFALQQALKNAQIANMGRRGSGLTATQLKALQAQKLSQLRQEAVQKAKQLTSTGDIMYMGDSNDVGASGGQAFTWSGKKLSSEEALDKVMHEIYDQLAELNLGEKDLQDTEELVRRALGLPTKQLTPKQQYENKVYSDLNARGDLNVSNLIPTR